MQFGNTEDLDKFVEVFNELVVSAKGSIEESSKSKATNGTPSKDKLESVGKADTSTKKSKEESKQ